MCIINVQEMNSLQTKTLIFFSSGPYFGNFLPDSYVVEYTLELSLFIRELRTLDITEFPVICYDNDNLKLASMAFWIFESIGYSVKLLYGDISIFSSLNQKLISTSKNDLPRSQILMDIDINKLLNIKFYDSVSLELTLPLYLTIGPDINAEKVKKYLLNNNVPDDFDGFILSGPFAGIIGILLKYLGNYQNRIFLGEWKDLNLLRVISTKNDTFYSAAGSIYYDAVEGGNEEEMKVTSRGYDDEIDSPKTPYLNDIKSPEPVKEISTVDPYDSHLMISKSSLMAPKPQVKDELQGYHCACQAF